MKSISIKHMKLQNFKGIKSLEIDFDKQTHIYGDNATGKTTVFDAFTWVLFGKDSKDRSDFNIKSLDENGNAIQKTEHIVEVTLLIDNQEVKLKRIYKEKWTKKKGSLYPEFTGNVTDFYHNDVPLKKNEFDKEVESILNEQVFKMITNPLAFTSMNWKDQRSTLTKIVGTKSNEELARGNKDFEELVSKLSESKTLEKYELQIKASIAKAKQDIKGIPSRIDEVERSKPVPLNYVKIQQQLNELTNELENVEASLEDKSKALDIQLNLERQLKQEMNDVLIHIDKIKSNLKTKAQSISNDTKEAIKTIEASRDKDINSINELEADKKRLEVVKQKQHDEIKSCEEKIAYLRKSFEEESNKKIDFGSDDDFKCPTCGRIHEQENIEAKKKEMLQNFNLKKSQQLEEINKEGQELKVMIESYQSNIPTLEERIKVIEEKITEAHRRLKSFTDKVIFLNEKLETLDWEKEYNNLIKNNTDLIELENDYDRLQEESQKFKTTSSSATDDLRNKKKLLLEDIEKLKAELRTKDEIAKANNRIEELNELEKTLAQSIADVDKELYVIEEFTKLQINDLEGRVNDLFEYVDFKLFKEQVNGGVAPTCEATVNGVPFSDVNTAGQINAGLGIINTLCDFYNVTAPIFIDNAESVTKLIETKGQIISLIVSPEHKQLKVA